MQMTEMQVQAEREKTMQAKEIARELMHYLNKFDDSRLPILAKEIRREHRTLQQTMFAFMMELMTQWSKDYDEGNYDPRNEHTVKTSKEIMDKINRWVPTI
jgi:DNA polymerase/3'-5' exonuclease PolX